MSNCQCLCPQGLSKILPTPPPPHFDPPCPSAIFALPRPRTSYCPAVVIPHQFRCSCHCEPVLTLAWQSASPSVFRTAVVLSFRASPQTGVGIRSPKAPSGGFIYCCGAARRTYLLRCKAPQKTRFDNRPPHRREFPKGEGAHALSLWTLQGDRIFKGRGKFGIPLPLNGVFGYFCRC